MSLNIGFSDLYPPTRVCIDPRCATESSTSYRSRELTDVISYNVTIFMKDLGPVPGWAFSARCPCCGARYYPNYLVEGRHHQSRRTYYTEVPAFIQVSMHYYVDTRLAEMFTNMMVCAWVSATNSSRIYNLSFSGMEEHIGDKWPWNLKLTCDHVWDAFFIYALLLDANERNVPLNLDHNAPDNAQRLRAALDARNELALRAAVSDGITIGHPCCAHHDCKNPLPTQRSKFCVEHASLSSLCAVTTCSRSVELNFQTCSLPEHRKLENVGLEQYTALFQLRRRLDKLKTTHVEDSVESPSATLHADELVEVDAHGECASKSPEGNIKLWAVFGRRRTHNEQLCVTTCGIILGRATFFGSEGPYGVVVCPRYSCLSFSVLICIKKFHEKLFPTPQSVPGVIFYDNNCHIKRVLEKSRNLHFQRRLFTTLTQAYHSRRSITRGKPIYRQLLSPFLSWKPHCGAWRCLVKLDATALRQSSRAWRCLVKLDATALSLEPSSDQFPGSRTNSMGTTSNLCLPTFMILASKAPLPPCIIFISYPVSASPQDTVPTNANTLTTTRTASSNLQLSTLLTEAYTENEALKKKLTNTRKHAEKAERLLQMLTDASSSSPTSESSAKCIIIEYENRVGDLRSQEAREAFGRIFFINHDNIPQSTHAKLRKQIHPPTIKTIPREWRTEDVLFRLESSCPPAITTNRTHTPSLRHIHISIAINNTIPIMRFRVDPIQGLQVALAALHWTLMRCSLKPLQPTPSTASLRINDHNNHRIWRVFLYQLQPHLKMGPRICRATTHEDTPRRGSSSRRVHVYEGQQAQEGLGPINAPIVAPPAQVFPATNAQGQRICRQCGFPRRYKDDNVEKWGPGPMGPRTVCDQCKRVERRGTLETQQQVAVMHQKPSRGGSMSQLPLSQGSDRSIHRTDMVLTHHGSFLQPSQSQSQILGREPLQAQPHAQTQAPPRSSHSHPSHTSHLRIPTVTQVGGAGLNCSPPPSTAAFEEDEGEEEDAEHEREQEHDGEDGDSEQLPLSNVGRGGKVGSRSRAGVKKNGATAAGGKSSTGGRNTPAGGRRSTPARGGGEKYPCCRRKKHASWKKHSIRSEKDDASKQKIAVGCGDITHTWDGDAEAEAEAEILGAVEATGGGDQELVDADGDAEAELLEAVDAAEANSSSSSSHGGPSGGGWMKEEDGA
ncbi:uncharacterized protein LACBIDRAFT_332257 [Laccaria bicolor S238N-H82]|uniref:Predicted protein n=1 Tax=Laccaria bicolor (strain S238N-H82 / ATCC MYA-4686) TaxID=486041 RepID=B0DS42_LACBS|nr:uncharacterized protein LACBIDRAFT_332257 [Laccaria bicolor S238N-H82]EDR02633.1 predicted protein [Laccaria bicolor S238N-H82]|eukprot:XP_001886677.1 predicted protein [Laccaria bicolor S238N-H82]